MLTVKMFMAALAAEAFIVKVAAKMLMAEMSMTEARL